MYCTFCTHSCCYVTILHTGKSRGEVVLIHAIQAYKGSGGIAPLNLNLGTR